MKVNLMELSRQLREDQVLMCFSGPFSHTIIEELGKAVRHFMENVNEPPTAVMDVFSVYIELSQNVRNYTINTFGGEAQGEQSIITISRQDGHYVVSSGNIIRRADADALDERLRSLGELDRAGLRRLYKETLRAAPAETEPTGATGAGLGLIEIARKAHEPLEHVFDDVDDDHVFFSLRVTV